jgi:hypothetical protein
MRAVSRLYGSLQQSHATEASKKIAEMVTPYFKALLHGETRQAKSMKLVLALVGGAAAFVAPVRTLRPSKNFSERGRTR